MRHFLAVLSGYLVFAGSAVLLFQVSGVDPHGASSLPFRVFGILYGMLFGFLSGVIAQRLAPKNGKGPSIAVATIIALAGLVSIIASPGDHAIWTQTASILLFAPLCVVGGSWAAAHKR